MKFSPPREVMTDRVDVLRRPQAIAGQSVVGQDETVVDFAVPCLILEASAARAQTILGTLQENAFVAYIDDLPLIEVNDVLRVVGSGARYVVRTSRKYPSPHDCQMQALELSLDVVATGAPVP